MQQPWTLAKEIHEHNKDPTCRSSTDIDLTALVILVPVGILSVLHVYLDLVRHLRLDVLAKSTCDNTDHAEG